MMLRLIGEGAATRETLEKALAGLRDYRGFHSRIALGADRVNGALTVLRYEQDEIREVGEVNAGTGEEGGVQEGGGKR
jgi:hypothetical protein